MTDRPTIDREDVVAILADFRAQPTDEIPERIDSLELAWLVHQVEQRYGVRLDLDDGQLAQMTTVSDAVGVLRDVIESVRNG